MTYFGPLRLKRFFGGQIMRARSGRRIFLCSTFPNVFTSMIDTTDDFEDSDETDATVQQYQEYFGNLYDLGFRLVSIGP